MFWIDIDNPPQVQYLAPIYRELSSRGLGAILTARDNGITRALLDNMGLPYICIGHAFSKSMLVKVTGTAHRGWQLQRALRSKKPSVLIAAGRASALAARILGIPTYIICDYEHAEIGLYARLGAHIIAPAVIPAQAFLQRGFSKARVHAFTGLKEDLSLYHYDVSTHPAYSDVDQTRVIVAYRPPAVETHYYASASGALSKSLLAWLAAQPQLTVIFLPRYPWQAEELNVLQWRAELIVPANPIHFLSLLKSSDLVISSGGTMLREAAAINVPAFSIFQSKIGAVDNHLMETGRLTFIRDEADFSKIKLEKKRAPVDTISNRRTMSEILGIVMAAHNQSRGKEVRQ